MKRDICVIDPETTEEIKPRLYFDEIENKFPNVYNNGSILVTLVSTINDLPNIEDYYNDLLVEYEKVGLSININKNDNIAHNRSCVYTNIRCGCNNII